MKTNIEQNDKTVRLQTIRHPQRALSARLGFMRWIFVAILGFTLFTSAVSCDAAPDKWEYIAVVVDRSNAGTPQELMAILNRLGEAGWELVEVNAEVGMAIFKRPK
jgi:hypothetical protein